MTSGAARRTSPYFCEVGYVNKNEVLAMLAECRRQNIPVEMTLRYVSTVATYAEDEEDDDDDVSGLSGGW